MHKRQKACTTTANYLILGRLGAVEGWLVGLSAHIQHKQTGQGSTYALLLTAEACKGEVSPDGALRAGCAPP